MSTITAALPTKSTSEFAEAKANPIGVFDISQASSDAAKNAIIQELTFSTRLNPSLLEIQPNGLGLMGPSKFARSSSFNAGWSEMQLIHKELALLPEHMLKAVLDSGTKFFVFSNPFTHEKSKSNHALFPRNYEPNRTLPSFNRLNPETGTNEIVVSTFRHNQYGLTARIYDDSSVHGSLSAFNTYGYSPTIEEFAHAYNDAHFSNGNGGRAGRKLSDSAEYQAAIQKDSNPTADLLYPRNVRNAEDKFAFVMALAYTDINKAQEVFPHQTQFMQKLISNEISRDPNTFAVR